MKIFRILIIIVVIAIVSGGTYYFIRSQKKVALSVEEPVTKDKDESQEISQEDTRRDISLLSIGNSDLYSGLNPMQLWHDYGITAFNISAAKQNMKLSYYMLKYALLVQKPKCILLEVDQFFEKREDVEPEGYEYTALSYCYPLFRNTSYWEKVKNEDFIKKEDSTHRLNYLGYYDNREIKKYRGGFDYMRKTSKKEKLPSLTEKYLPKIISLARQNDCQILFVEFPSQSSWNYAKYNTVNELAKQYQVPYLDFNISQYDTHFDWKTDSRDAGNHLNYYGAKKMTKFMGQYLKKNYDLTDHRKDDKYQDYEEIYKKYVKNFMK